jgi:hypothetical protein
LVSSHPCPHPPAEIRIGNQIAEGMIDMEPLKGKVNIGIIFTES